MIKNTDKRILKKFLNLLDRDIDIKASLEKFPKDQETLKKYVEIIESFKTLKNIRPNNKFEENSLKNIYTKTRTEDIENQQKDFKKDFPIIRLRPAYIKPLAIFISIFIFIIFSFTGTIYASSETIPGELLYTIKRASETIQVAITPYKYENGIYLKMLDSRLEEAEQILKIEGIESFIDKISFEKLITDIDETYKICRNRNYLNIEQDTKIQIRMGEVKEGFKKRYGMHKNNTNNFYNPNIENNQNSNNFNIHDQDCEQSNYGSNKKYNIETNNFSNIDKQNQSSNQYQYRHRK